MNTFLKVLIALGALTVTIVGALIIFDKLTNKHRIKGNYLDCDSPEDEFGEEDI